jgi:hypothetical protein
MSMQETMEQFKVRSQFMTLEDAWEEFLQISGIGAKNLGAEEMDACKRIFWGGCQAFGFCLAHIKNANENDIPTAIQKIGELYQEMDFYAKETHRQDAMEDALARGDINMRNPWPFPTGSDS